MLFKDAPSLGSLFNELLRQATLSFGAEDVLHFLGRKMTPQFQGEMKTKARRREEGSRIKHWMKQNWIKMETVRPLVSNRMARILVVALVAATLTVLLVSRAAACDPGINC